LANGSHEVRYVRLAPSLAAVLPDGLFEHPAGYSDSIFDRDSPVLLRVKNSFSTVCRSPLILKNDKG
jgi:hypothetical protein